MPDSDPSNRTPDSGPDRNGGALPGNARQIRDMADVDDDLRHGEVGSRDRPAMPHHPDESVEQVARVVRAGTGFGVVLNAEDRAVRVPESGHRVVVEVPVRDLATRLRK